MPEPEFLWWTLAEWQIAEAVATIVAVIAAATAALIAGSQLKEARTAREAAVEPYVVASPIPEASEGRQACLLIKNYGQTAAHDIEVTFPEERVLIDDRRPEGGGLPLTSSRTLKLPVTTLAPGQEIREWIAIMAGPIDGASIREATVVVTFKDWRDKPITVGPYRIRHGALGLGYGDDIPTALLHIAKEVEALKETLRRWSAFGERSVSVSLKKAPPANPLDHLDPQPGEPR